MNSRFLYAGAQAVGEYDSSGGLIRRYVPGAGLDDYAAYTTGTGGGITRDWPVVDPLGSVVGITNSSAIATQINTYDEYGVPGSGFSGRFGYAGSMYLNRAMAAPWNMRNRQYNPSLGRFMQTDPIGIAGGVNLYAYVGNDPVNLTDPWGLQVCPRGPDGEFKCPDIIVTGNRCQIVTCIIDPFELDRFLERFGWNYFPGRWDGMGGLGGPADERPCPAVPSPGLSRAELDRRANAMGALLNASGAASGVGGEVVPRAVLFGISLPGAINDTKSSSSVSYVPGSQEFGNFLFWG